MNPRSVKNDNSVKAKPSVSEEVSIFWITDRLPEDDGEVLIDNGQKVVAGYYSIGNWFALCGEPEEIVFRWAEFPKSCEKAVTPDWENMKQFF